MDSTAVPTSLPRAPSLGILAGVADATRLSRLTRLPIRGDWRNGKTRRAQTKYGKMSKQTGQKLARMVTW